MHCQGCSLINIHARFPTMSVCDNHVKPKHDDDIYQSTVRATNVWSVIYVHTEAPQVCAHAPAV